MNDTSLQEPASSTESPTTATPEPRTETPVPAESSPPAEPAKSPQQPQPSRYAPVIIGSPDGDAASPLADIAAFVKRTWRVWLLAGGAILGSLLLIALLQWLAELARNAQERRFERAIASVTPERLIARCGQPAEDVTKEVFPVVMRTIRYERGRSDNLLLTFSRTAEQQSDWVFLSMKDENGGKSLDTVDSKIAALSCLDSTK